MRFKRSRAGAQLADAVALCVTLFGVVALLGLQPFTSIKDFVIGVLVGGVVYGAVRELAATAHRRVHREGSES